MTFVRHIPALSLLSQAPKRIPVHTLRRAGIRIIHNNLEFRERSTLAASRILVSIMMFCCTHYFTTCEIFWHQLAAKFGCRFFFTVLAVPVGGLILWEISGVGHWRHQAVVWVQCIVSVWFGIFSCSWLIWSVINRKSSGILAVGHWC